MFKYNNNNNNNNNSNIAAQQAADSKGKTSVLTRQVNHLIVCSSQLAKLILHCPFMKTYWFLVDEAEMETTPPKRKNKQQADPERLGEAGVPSEPCPGRWLSFGQRAKGWLCRRKGFYGGLPCCGRSWWRLMEEQQVRCCATQCTCPQRLSTPQGTAGPVHTRKKSHHARGKAGKINCLKATKLQRFRVRLSAGVHQQEVFIGLSFSLIHL